MKLLFVALFLGILLQAKLHSQQSNPKPSDAFVASIYNDYVTHKCEIGLANLKYTKQSAKDGKQFCDILVDTMHECNSSGYNVMEYIISMSNAMNCKQYKE